VSLSNTKLSISQVTRSLINLGQGQPYHDIIKPNDSQSVNIKFLRGVVAADEVDSGIPPKVIDVHDPTDTRKRIKGLNPDTEYVVYVQSCTEVGCGKPVNATTGKTAPDGGTADETFTLSFKRDLFFWTYISLYFSGRIPNDFFLLCVTSKLRFFIVFLN
jgi:Rieske Fe-S protein